MEITSLLPAFLLSDKLREESVVLPFQNMLSAYYTHQYVCAE